MELAIELMTHYIGFFQKKKKKKRDRKTEWRGNVESLHEVNPCFGVHLCAVCKYLHYCPGSTDVASLFWVASPLKNKMEIAVRLKTKCRKCGGVTSMETFLLSYTVSDTFRVYVSNSRATWGSKKA
jgi:hypothetical protein